MEDDSRRLVFPTVTVAHTIGSFTPNQGGRRAFQEEIPGPGSPEAGVPHTIIGRPGLRDQSSADVEPAPSSGTGGSNFWRTLP